MPFRDDYEALLARVESLERQLGDAREDRARVAQELETARAELEGVGKGSKPGARAAKSRPSPRGAGDEALTRASSRRGRIAELVGYASEQWWGVMGLMVLGAAGLLGVLVWYSDHAERSADANDPGKLRGVRLAPLEDGSSALVLMESVFHPGGEDPDWYRPRVDVVDPRDGHRRARVAADGLETCASAGPGRLWCGSPTGIELRETATLRVLASHAQIVAKSPAFAAKRGDPCVDPRSSEAWTMLDDGRFLRTDPRTLAGVVEEHELDPASCPAIALSSQGTTSAIQVQGESVQPRGGPRAVLQIEGGDRVWRPLAPDVAFLSPSFLVDPASAPILLEGGQVFLVVHSESLDEHAPLVVTAMGKDGVRRWTRALGPGTVVAGWLFEDRVVVAVGGSGGYLLALAAADGRVLWKYAA